VQQQSRYTQSELHDDVRLRVTCVTTIFEDYILQIQFYLQRVIYNRTIYKDYIQAVHTVTHTYIKARDSLM